MNGKNREKIDVVRAVQLRLVQKMSYREIAERFGVKESTLKYNLSELFGILRNTEELDAYERHKARLFSLAEKKLLKEIFDAGKLKKASLNNVAYAFSQIHSANRLERGQSTQNVDFAQLTIDLNELRKRRQLLEQELLKHVDGATH